MLRRSASGDGARAAGGVAARVGVVVGLALAVTSACSSRRDAASGSGSGSASGTGAGSASGTGAGSGAVALPPLPSKLVWTPLPASPPFLATRVRTTNQTRCAVSRDGRVACWGDLGGTPYVHTGIVHVAAGITDVVDATMFYGDLCVIRRDGTSDCLPTFDESRLPDLPSQAVGLEKTVTLLCVLDRRSTVSCFDANGTAEGFVPVTGIVGATALRCNDAFCCATTPAGLRCFGRGAPDVGILESTYGRPPIIEVPPATTIAAHSFGACVRTQAGGAHCWGDAKHLSRPSGVRDVTLYNLDLCAILDDGRIECSGGMQELAHVIAADGPCVVHDDGSVSCHGNNTGGELGDGKPTFATTPQRVPGLANIIDLHVTETQACALARDRTLTCWGWARPTTFENVTGMFGTGDDPTCTITGRALVCRPPSLQRSAPLEVVRAELGTRAAIKSFATYNRSICIVDSKGAVSCGTDIRDERIEWRAVAGPPAIELADSSGGLCARLVGGRVGCFDPDAEESLAMKLVSGIDAAAQLTGGAAGSCVLTRGGEVQCWDDRDPELRTFAGLRGASVISGRGGHVCGIVKGAIRCGGRNLLGQLGDGTRTDPAYGDAVAVNASFKVAKIGAFGRGTCALDTAGFVWCWGSDQDGTLGQGRLPQGDEPSSVVGLGPR